MKQYNDTAACVMSVIEQGADLSPIRRVIFSQLLVKNVVRSHTSFWGFILSTELRREHAEGKKHTIFHEYREKIEIKLRVHLQ